VFVCSDVADELNRLKTKERYINTQFSLLSNDYKEIKQRLEELEAKSSKTNENVTKFTNELAEISEKLDDLKESFESKDSGMHDTSPLVRIKTALQHLKSEIASHDLRIGVVAHSLLAARVVAANRKRMGVAKIAKRRRNRHSKSGTRGGGDDSSLPSDDEYH
jgi:intraflagellar transport protein 57